jgi:hypothetical protein
LGNVRPFLEKFEMAGTKKAQFEIWFEYRRFLWMVNIEDTLEIAQNLEPSKNL